MIRALFTQELRHTLKPLLTGLGILGLITVIGCTLAALSVPFVGSVGLVFAVIATLLIMPFALLVLVMTYWRTMYGAEGYFTMTIPVRGRTIFGVKVGYGLLTTLLACVLMLGGLALAVMAFSVGSGQGAFDVFRDMAERLDAPFVWVISGAFLLQLVCSVVAGAALMSIGAEARFNHLGFGAPVIGGVVLYFVMQLVMFAALLFLPVGVLLTGPDAGSVVAEGMLADFLAALADPNGNATPNVLGLGIFIVPVLATVGLAWWGARSVDRRTSLR